MELLEAITIDEVVALWLSTEINSPRFGARLRALLQRDRRPLSIVESPRLTDPDACSYRMRLLGEFRGFGLPRQPEPNYIDGFAVDQLEWSRVRIGPEDVARMHFIDWDYWVEVTGGSRLAATLAARQLAAPDRVRDVDDPLLMTYLTGGSIPEVILVDAGADSRLVILEGHVRATVMAMAGERLPPLTAILGRGQAAAEWDMY